MDIPMQIMICINHMRKLFVRTRLSSFSKREFSHNKNNSPEEIANYTVTYIF